MPGRVKVAVFAAMAVSALMIVVKLFTTEVWLADEPTVLLALRSKPALTNSVRIRDEADLHGMRVLVTDENGFVGQGFYEVVTAGGWLVGVAVMALAAVYLVGARRAAA